MPVRGLASGDSTADPELAGRVAVRSVSDRTLGLLAAAATLAFVVAAFIWLRPPSIIEDWMGWRQVDTQTIARHFTEPGASLWYPRIDWGGDGPGYVETEFQLFPWLASLVMRVFGEAEWPGQLISLLSVGGAALLLFDALGALYGRARALAGLAVFLGIPSIVLVATKVQPEALCLFLYVAAWRSFLRWESRGSTVDLAFYAAFGAVAMLVKPTAAQLGVSSFVVLALRSRHLLRTAPVWVAWAVMLGALAAFLWHGHSIYVEYHNTFGVLSGGGTKVPKLRHLLMPGSYRLALRTNVVWGLGALGTLAVGALLVRRRVDATVWGLAAGAAVWTLVSLRYICNVDWGGSHYTIIDGVLAAHATAALLPEARPGWVRGRLAAPALALTATLASIVSFAAVRRDQPPNEQARKVIASGRVLASIASPGDLVIARSAVRVHDSFWSNVFNFEDPRVFYLSRTHGWVLGADDVDPGRLAHLAARGARYYVEPAPDFVDAPIDGWLSEHAKLVAETDLGGRVFALGTR